MKKAIIWFPAIFALFLFASPCGGASCPNDCDTSFTTYNTFLGTRAGGSTTGGYFNTFLGADAGAGNISGDLNTFVGYAGLNNTDGDENTFLGYGAGFMNTTGKMNTFIGGYTGWENWTGEKNTFVGYRAGQNTGGSENTFIGISSGSNNANGNYNAFLGGEAGYQNTSANFNTIIGYKAGYSNTEGDENTFVGNFAGYMTTGIRNVFLGNEAGRFEAGSNKLYIDNSNIETPLIWGDFSTNQLVVYGGFKAVASYSASDIRLKKNIEPLTSCLEKVSYLEGVRYEWKNNEYPHMGLTEGKQIGLVAQDVEKTLPELVTEDKDGYKAVSYSQLTAVLVEAVKELKSENRHQKRLLKQQADQFRKQQAEIETLRSMIMELKS